MAKRVLTADEAFGRAIQILVAKAAGTLEESVNGEDSPTEWALLQRCGAFLEALEREGSPIPLRVWTEYQALRRALKGYR